MSLYFLRAFLAVVTISCSFSSCSFGPYIDPTNVPEDLQKKNIYYIPSSSNIPSLHKEKNFATGFNSSFASKIERTELFAVYAPIPQLGIFASFGSGSKEDKVDLTETSLALGYIRPVSPNWQFETYGGFDIGKIENNHYTGFSQINTTRLFLQPSFFVHNLKNTVELAFVSRFTTAHTKIATSTFNQRGEPYSANQLKNIASAPNHIFLEPGIMLRFGWPTILVNFNYTASAIVAGENFYRSTGCFSFGAIARFHVAKKQPPAASPKG